jgi:hypothetical protein
MLNSVLKKESIEDEIDPAPQAKSANANTRWPRLSSGSGVKRIPIMAAINTELYMSNSLHQVGSEKSLRIKYESRSTVASHRDNE